MEREELEMRLNKLCTVVAGYIYTHACTHTHGRAHTHTHTHHTYTPHTNTHTHTSVALLGKSHFAGLKHCGQCFVLGSTA